MIDWTLRRRRAFATIATFFSLALLTVAPTLADRQVTVQSGDTLSSISLANYGDLVHIQRIADYNRLGDANRVRAGQVLLLPDLDGVGSQSGGPPTAIVSPLLTAADLIRQSASAPLRPAATPAAAPSPVVAPSRSLTAPAPPRAGPVIQTGLATWYGPGFDNNPTKCGPIYHQWQYTAASNDLPCGTVVQVTNQANGRSVVVTITDTGAFRHPNILDLSLGAFSAIASTDSGVIQVSVVLVSE